VKHLQEPRNRRRGSRFSKKDQEDEESDDDSELGGSYAKERSFGQYPV